MQRRRPPHHARAARSGFTLVEVVFSALVLTLSVVAMTQAVVAGHQANMQAVRDLHAMALAEAMLEEVVSKATVDPETGTPGGPEERSRSQYDDQDDYDGYTEALGAVADAASVAYGPPYDVFTRTVVVEPESISGLSGNPRGYTVTVVVADNKGQTWSVSRFVSEGTP
jgi:type II secretory pathway pseudopilin PulG